MRVFATINDLMSQYRIVLATTQSVSDRLKSSLKRMFCSTALLCSQIHKSRFSLFSFVLS